MTRRDLLLLTLAGAVVTANAYYIHPIIALVAKDFGVSASAIGLVPALNQIALALGIFFLLPLGDRFSNRQLAIVFAAGQFVGLLMMAFGGSFWLFVAGSTFLGFSTITPYLLPAYASKRVAPGDLGRVTATLTTGVIAGILLARVGAGWVGEHLGWRTVYYIAAGVMLVITLLLPRIMDGREKSEDQAPAGSYFGLVLSMFPIVRRHPEVLISGTIQGIGFGVFLSVWLTLGLHLTSPEMGYGADTVGYLAGLALLNLLTTAPLGAWADRTGPRKARLIISIVQFSGVCLLGVFGHSLWLLMIPLTMMNVVGPLIDVTGRMTFLSQPPGVRTRLMTAYIVLMFIGGGVASWAATFVYEQGGWAATTKLTLVLSALLVMLSFLSLVIFGKDAGRSKT
ncbi:major facilitator family transporter [Hyphomonas neptunium ATCC 15444]|uniref:Major facilitator family transporter n=2 Tax=Hyphomonas TaxID=85 RepID=Q0C3N5_HYPNA|nr:MFS transporter [Hyphomonas hirschiana]ABI76498.1 major facilitator family transporter [Hyphomonas neptunium ATCC 15444]KCZ96131.1 major facilitator family transporter [Hyphomonas hirschiana VP5]